jgi:pilus assembly protein Flp/PilA
MTRAEMKISIKKFLRENRGVTALEYGLIAGLISIAIATSVGQIGDSLTTLFSNVSTALTNALK